MTLRPVGTVAGAPLGYVEYVPPGYGDGTSRPLLIFLHGVDENGGGSGRELARLFKLGVPKLIESDKWPEDRPFVVLMPQYGPQTAGQCRSAEELASFLDFAMDHYDIDERRVYLTGVSCGAIDAWEYLGAYRDDVIAAAVLIAGGAEYAFDTAGCALGRVPIWAFHGDVDSTVPKVHIVEPMTKLKACTNPSPVDLRLTIYPRTDHDAWTRTYDLSAGHDVYAWLLGHERR
jgi:predicted peptidase